MELDHTTDEKGPIIGIVIEEHRLGLMVLTNQEDKVRQAPREWYAFDSWQAYELTIFNPTSLSKLIHAFISAHNLSNARAIIALEGKNIYELLLSQRPVHSPVPEGYAWSVYGVAESCWYVAAVPYTLRAQYHLLSFRLPIPILRITTVTAAYCVMLATDKKMIFDASRHTITNLKDTVAETYKGKEDAFIRGLYAIAQQ